MAEEPIIVKLAGWVHTCLAFAREKISLILPSTKFLGFLDLTTIVLILISLLISFLIFRKQVTGIRAIPIPKFLLVSAIIFAGLRFL